MLFLYLFSILVRHSLQSDLKWLRLTLLVRVVFFILGIKKAYRSKLCLVFIEPFPIC